ncbi:MAG: hypothetical protein O2816_18885 [Planctomycetota bacterium]|nr:hypothetical protein [Planctomycetota bacterium]
MNQTHQNQDVGAGIAVGALRGLAILLLMVSLFTVGSHLHFSAQGGSAEIRAGESMQAYGLRRAGIEGYYEGLAGLPEDASWAEVEREARRAVTTMRWTLLASIVLLIGIARRKIWWMRGAVLGSILVSLVVSGGVGWLLLLSGILVLLPPVQRWCLAHADGAAPAPASPA